MAGNNKKAAANRNPLDELQALQSQLDALREKQLSTLEKQLETLEKQLVTQKTRTDKAREDVKRTKLAVAEKAGSRPSIIQRAQASLERAEARFVEEQEKLAGLQRDAVDLKLEIRKEKAVRKALKDTEKTLKSPNTPDKPSTTEKQAAAPSTAKPSNTPASKATATAKTAEKPANTSKAPAAKKQTTVAKSSEKPIKETEKPKTPAKSEAKPAATSKPAETPAPAAAPAEKPAESRPPAAPAPRPVPQRQIVHRMSDIPSHPDKAEDRLASLFENF